MPLYDARCEPCDRVVEFYAHVSDRHQTPLCTCGRRTDLVISPVMGRVMFPAAGGQEYVSPASGKYITSTRQRKDDLARTGCRPWEGFQSEAREAAKRVAEDDKKSDAKLHDNVSRAFHQLSPKQKRHLGA